MTCAHSRVLPLLLEKAYCGPVVFGTCKAVEAALQIQPEAQRQKEMAGLLLGLKRGALVHPHLVSKETQELAEFYEGFAVEMDSLETLYRPFQCQGCLD